MKILQTGLIGKIEIESSAMNIIFKLGALAGLLVVLFGSSFSTYAQGSPRNYPLILHGNGTRKASITICHNRARLALKNSERFNIIGDGVTRISSYIEGHKGLTSVAIRCSQTNAGIKPMVIIATNYRDVNRSQQLAKRLFAVMRTGRIAGQTRRPPNSSGSRAGSVNSTRITWSATATSKRGKNNQRFRYYCAPNGRPGRVWGTTYYTDDSSICEAAVHAGRIRRSTGGYVTIEIRPGRRSYISSSRNGVTSSGYGVWRGSFVFVR